MRKIVESVAAVLCFTLLACESPKEKSLKEIETLEAQDSVFNPENLEKQKNAYMSFADKYPDDERTPEFLFKSAQRLGAIAAEKNNIQMHEEAIQLFEKIINTYPKNHYAEESMFLIGFVYENHLNNTAKAKQAYEKFLQQYPNSELAEDAQKAITYLGKSPEEVLQNITAPTASTPETAK